MIDFRKLQKGSAVQKVNPKEIYESLDRQTSTGPLRPNQEEVLGKWFNYHRQDKNVIIKMHTGEGKTLVGLLLLQSKINEGKGPCLYLCPNRYLVSQVVENAKRFGIKCQTTESTSLPTEFTNGKEILVTTVQKLFNGKSVFGVDTNPLQVGTIVLDDSHACMDAIRSSYSITLERNTSLWNYILDKFELPLKRQAEGTFISIKDNDSGDSLMRIPYWNWAQESCATLEFFSKRENEDDALKFTFPLLKNIWEMCNVYISHRQILIEPDFSLISKFKTFTHAEQRVFMTATTQDDSFFIKVFDVDEETIKAPVTPSSSKWWGEKMILFPTNIDGSFNENFFRYKFCGAWKQNTPNRAVLVPSFKIAEEYEKGGAIVVNKSNVSQCLRDMQREAPQKALVFANRYDGVDLPDSMCRILIMDSLPCYGNLADIFEQRCRSSSTIVKAKTSQKIEQGLGRSVRGEKDYSVILLVGNSLVEFVNTRSNQEFFSEQTLKQLQLGGEITNKIKEDEENPKEALFVTMNQCLKRDEGWKEYYAQEMGGIQKTQKERPYVEFLKKEREAEKALSIQDYEKAKQIYRTLSNGMSEAESDDKGWYLEKVAKCNCLLLNKEDMEKEQMAARRYNNNLFVVVNADKIKLSEEEMAFYDEAKSYISRFKTDEEFMMTVKSELSSLSFGKPSKQFEAALDFIGKLLAFTCERPDNTLHVGPDNLWLASDGGFVAIECKNEVSLNRNTISKDEAGQFNNHIGWMKGKHPGKRVDYVIVHPTSKLDERANLNADVRCITPEKLDLFKKRIGYYVEELMRYGIKNLSGTLIMELLESNQLTRQQIIQKYTVVVR